MQKVTKQRQIVLFQAQGCRNVKNLGGDKLGMYSNTGPYEGLKIRGCQYYLVGIIGLQYICPLL